MEENLNLNDAQATIPDTQKDFSLSVRFNKEDVDLDYDSAVKLTQKGMKFELIEDDYRRVKDLALKDGKTLSQFVSSLEEDYAAKHRNEILSMCGGNEQLCNKMIDMENAKGPIINDGFYEVSANFPEIDDIEKLPVEVVENSKLKGSNLLDEYLRYLLKTSKMRENSEKEVHTSELSSVGSQTGSTSAFTDTARNEFIKGIWSKN